MRHFDGRKPRNNDLFKARADKLSEADNPLPPILTTNFYPECAGILMRHK